MTNYADDNTPHDTADEVVSLLNILEQNVEVLITWFKNNYFKLNADKCKLLVSNHDEDASIFINGEIVEGNTSVKLLVTSVTQLVKNSMLWHIYIYIYIYIYIIYFHNNKPRNAYSSDLPRNAKFSV